MLVYADIIHPLHTPCNVATLISPYFMTCKHNISRLFVGFLEGTMIHPVDAPVEFEISIGKLN